MVTFPDDTASVYAYHQIQAMPRLTDNQLLHRQYLQSPIWKAKRQEALAHYGPICNRCHRHGTDVHHKTYERVGGSELMEDLEILCRECHEAHHRAERATRQTKPAKIKSIDRRAIFSYLTKSHQESLIREFDLGNTSGLSLAINHGDIHIALAAAELLGFNDVHGGPTRRRNRSKPSCWRAPKPRQRPEKWMSFAEFKTSPNPLSGPIG